MTCEVLACSACGKGDFRVEFVGVGGMEWICKNCRNSHDEKPFCGGEMKPFGSEGAFAGYECEKCGHRVYGRVEEKVV